MKIIVLDPGKEATFRKMWCDPNVTIGEVEFAIGHDHATLRRIARTMCLGEKYRTSPWTPEFTALIIRRYTAGEECIALAREFGLTRNTITAKMARLGHIRKRPSAPASKQEVSAPALRARPAPKDPIPRQVKLHPAGNRVYVVSEDRPLPAARDELTATVTLLGLNGRTCRWPIGDPQRDDFGFCGRKADAEAPYCPHHTRRAGASAGAAQRLDTRLGVAGMRSAG